MTGIEMNNELRDKAIAHLTYARRHFDQQQEAEPLPTGDERGLEHLGDEIHNASCIVIHLNEEIGEHLGRLASELWNWEKTHPPAAQQQDAEPVAWVDEAGCVVRVSEDGSGDGGWVSGHGRAIPDSWTPLHPPKPAAQPKAPEGYQIVREPKPNQNGQSFADRLAYWRAERPSEWLMDEFIRDAQILEAKLAAKEEGK